MHAASNGEASATISTVASGCSMAGATEPKGGVEPAASFPEQCERMHGRVYDLLAREPATERIRQVQRQTRISLGVIADALARYSLDELSFSYNGGKDCLVLLVLYLAALHSHAIGQEPPSAADNVPSTPIPPPSRPKEPLPQSLRSVYIVSPNPFPQVSAFVERSAAEYHLALTRYEKPMKEAFVTYLRDYPSVRAIFVGTRRTDPHGMKLTYFDPTDGGWPAFMRIHPVIDWHYVDIWTFIAEVGAGYCELYDLGYSSLGGTTDTFPNPALELRDTTVLNGQATKRYRPAYELIDDEEERLGRDR